MVYAMKAGEELPALWGRINAEGLAALTGAHITTAHRWKKLRTLPRWLETLVRTVAEGYLCAMGKPWRDWRIARDGKLYSPEGWGFTPGEIRALPLLRQQLRALQVRERLPGQADWISGRIDPLPGALVHDAAPKPGRVHDLAAYASARQANQDGTEQRTERQGQ